MSMGMSYEDYWDGDACKARYYRRMDVLRQERRNCDLWLLGAYVYEALLDASPALNPMSRKHKPFPYRETPFPVTEYGNARAEADANQKKLQAGRAAMRRMAAGINAQRKIQEEKGASVCPSN